MDLLEREMNADSGYNLSEFAVPNRYISVTQCLFIYRKQMEYLLLLSLVALIVFPLQIPSTRALHNVTVDDLDPAVVYIGQWNLGTDEPLSYAGGHHSSSTPGGRATFTFIGKSTIFVTHRRD